MKGKVEREQRMDVRSVSPFPDRVPDPQDPGPHRVSHATCQEHQGWEASPCRGTRGLQPHNGRVCRVYCSTPGGSRSSCPVVHPLLQGGFTAPCSWDISVCVTVWFIFLLPPHSPYITSSCPSTILNCCVHPASSLTLSVISLAAPGEGY